MSEVIQSDGYKSRLVIAINGKFPGPTIEAYEDQKLIIHVRNLKHTDSTTVHWHGIHQRESPEWDGVAFISQTPILPGRTFKAKPHGTGFYHAHIGDQRSMGLYGGFVVYPSYKFFPQPQYGFTVVLQDWNHDDDPETLSTNAKWRVRNKLMEPTQSIDGANFSRFHMHSALINGKGRLYTRQYDRYNTPIFTHNGASLEVFEIEYSKTYRFRLVRPQRYIPFVFTYRGTMY